MKMPNLKGWILLAISAVLFYFGMTNSVSCTGWNIINPFCYIGSFVKGATFMVLGGAVGIAALINLARRDKQ